MKPIDVTEADFPLWQLEIRQVFEWTRMMPELYATAQDAAAALHDLLQTPGDAKPEGFRVAPYTKEAWHADLVSLVMDKSNDVIRAGLSMLPDGQLLKLLQMK